MESTQNLVQRMRRQLPAELREFLQVAGGQAEAQGHALYLVGGAVRDLLLERPNTDFDLVLEGDAPSFARRLARLMRDGSDDRRLPDRVTIHPRFGTAKFQRGDITIDVVTARSETYARPGALPTVKPDTIRDDLFRRDFTINAMAIELMPASIGRLLDYFYGIKDLQRGLIRILHNRSFIDDATRMLRAVRYEQRLGFKLEDDTERLLKRDVSYLDTISGDRIRHELELICREDNPEQMLERAQTLGVLPQIHPALKVDGATAERLRRARQQGTTETDMYLSILAYPLSEEESEDFVERLNITGELKRGLKQLPRLKAKFPALASPNIVPSAVYRLLQKYHPGAIATCAFATDDPAVRSQLERYLNELRYVKTSLDGDALKALGVASGPRLGKMIETLREARLDGTVNTREEEASLVHRLLRED
jgi:tRNA nucleotidyltransferase (CCA-adding enzyme)